MAITYRDRRVTANELAKLIWFDRGDMGSEFWEENDDTDEAAMTDREKQQVEEALAKQRVRVGEFLRVDDIYDKRGI